jgi:DNA-binding transcriptional MerR regulator
MFHRFCQRLSAAIVVFALGSLAAAADDSGKAGGKTFDVAICLDVSNSMDGLIGSAKAKLWDIVNDMGKAKPTPNLRVALFSYGNDGYDRTKGWVRKELDFTTDLDKVNDKLFGLTTNGGTEYVTRVCRDALDQLQWTADASALKIIFVCGNEPASQDPEVKIKEIAEKAVRSGVIINPIYCGNAADGDAQDWKQLADLAEGRFASINQNRGAVAIATPFDKELATLSGQLNATFCFYGREAPALKDNQEKQDQNAAQAGAGVAAARADAKAGKLYRFEQDLVDKCMQDPKFDVKKIADEELPVELKKMKPEEREKHVKELVAKRKDLQKQIAELTKKREAFVREEEKKLAANSDKTFDRAIRDVLRDQAKKKGIELP